MIFFLLLLFLRCRQFLFFIFDKFINFLFPFRFLNDFNFNSFLSYIISIFIENFSILLDFLALLLGLLLGLLLFHVLNIFLQLYVLLIRIFVFRCIFLNGNCLSLRPWTRSLGFTSLISLNNCLLLLMICNDILNLFISQIFRVHYL